MATSDPKTPPKAKKPASTKAAKPKTPRVRRKRPVKQEATTPFLKRALKAVFYWGAVSAVWGLIVGACIVGFYAYDLPDVDDAFEATRKPAITLIAADGSELASVGDLYGMPASLDDMPASLPQAVMATEDRRFYSHFGVDVIGLARAMWTNVRAGRIKQGGSTITQQVAKNLFLTPERSLKRKMQELLLALWLEQKFSKDDILTVYLNRVYLGAGVWGVDAAAQKYFGRRVKNISVWQSAMIAGLLKAPSRYNPISSKKRAAERTNIVISNMVAAGYLTQEQAATARSEQGSNKSTATSGSKGYYVDWVMSQVADYIQVDRDIVIHTTFDPVIQRAADKSIKDHMDQFSTKQKVAQVAFVALSHGGAVRSMIGGRVYRDSQFNRATQAFRQPGSAFKPIVYAAGLIDGLKPTSTMRDEAVTIDGWTPKNYDHKYRGDMSLTSALANSVNTIAAKIMQRVGPQSVVELAAKLGIRSTVKPLPSIALGSEGVSLIDLTTTYGVFANGGQGILPYGIEKIEDRDGNLLYERSGNGLGQLISTAHASQMSLMLKAVVEQGTGYRAKLDRPVAGKTGTSQNNRDGWFVGYTGHLVAGVWMGNDAGKKPKKLSGGGLPAMIWQQAMEDAHHGLAPKPLNDNDAAAGSGTDEGLFGILKNIFGGD